MNRIKNILDKEVAEQKMQRLALEVAEYLSGDEAPLIIIGIRTSGMAVAQRICTLLQPYINVPVKIISVSFDKQKPKEILLSEPIDFTDNVINSGKTMLYALKPLLNYYPQRIQTLVLIERMHKLFPVKPDYVGLSLATTMDEHIHVSVNGDEVTGAYME